MCLCVCVFICMYVFVRLSFVYLHLYPCPCPCPCLSVSLSDQFFSNLFQTAIYSFFFLKLDHVMSCFASSYYLLYCLDIIFCIVLSCLLISFHFSLFCSAIICAESFISFYFISFLFSSIFFCSNLIFYPILLASLFYMYILYCLRQCHKYMLFQLHITINNALHTDI